MAHLNRWLMVGSVVASSLAGSTAEACWLTGCCGGAPRTTFYAPVAPVVTAVPNPCNTCAPANPCATGCNTCAAPALATTTFAQPTTALMPVTPVTAYRPGLFGGLFSGSATTPVATTLPYTAGYAPTTPYTVGYAPLATPAWTTAPYTSYRPVAAAPVSYAVPATYTAPVTVQYAPQPVAQATYYAPATTTLPTTTYMPATTVTPAPVTTSAPGCNCQSSTTTSSTSQYWTPNSSAVVSSTPITSGTITSSTTTSNGAVMTSGSTSTFGTTNQGSQGVLQQSAPQQAPAHNDNNVKPLEDPIKKSSTTTPGYEDPNNKTALMPLVDRSQLAETKPTNAPLVRSLEDLAPYNPVRMTSHAR